MKTNPSFIVSLLVFLSFVHSVPAVTHTVDAGGGADFTTIQAAIDAAASNNDAVEVAPGTYSENIILDKNIHLYSSGGADVTTVDGNINCSGAGVLVPTIEDFTVTGAGNGLDVAALENPTVIGCTFVDNMGSGINLINASMIISDSTFIDNTGSGIYIVTAYDDIASLTVDNCLFVSNTVGGIEIASGLPLPVSVSDSTFIGNTGSGIYHANRGTLIANHCSFINNSAERVSVGGYGGGVASLYEGELTMNGCLFAGNTAAIGGGGLVITGLINAVNCTFIGNRAADTGGAMIIYDIPLGSTVTNSILWQNDPNEIDILIGDSPAFSYNNIDGGLPAGFNDDGGNIDAEPNVVDNGYWDPNGTPLDPADDFWVNGDYRLLPDSPCIDAADATAFTLVPPLDLAASTRFYDTLTVPNTGVGYIDMGAYEHVCNLLIGDINCDGIVDLLDLALLSANWLAEA